MKLVRVRPAVSLAVLLLAAAPALAACGDDSSGASPSTTAAAAASSTTGASTTAPTTTAAPTTTLKTVRIMVTNDDGVDAPGLDSVVEGLRALPAVEVVVVAPSANQSGAGGKLSPAPPAVSDAKTASGYAAKAVAGTPADTVVWAIDQKGLPARPDIVISGSNIGQNLSTVNMLSGTVGAARAAGARGIPAIAVSQGLNADTNADFVNGTKQFLAWFTQNRAKIASAATSDGSPAPVWSFNAPSCKVGAIRGIVEVANATTGDGRDGATMDCGSTKTTFTDDIDAWNNGFAAVTQVPKDQVLQKG